MKSMLSRAAALSGVLAAIAVAAAPAGAAMPGGISEPPWSQFCADRFSVACAPVPGPFAL